MKQAKVFCILMIILILSISIFGITNAEGTKLKVGDYVVFGHYHQTTDGTDKTPIEWIVLEVQKGNALLLSHYGIDMMAYDSRSGSNITWEDCFLRKWLNDAFLNEAFTLEEQKNIIEVTLDNSEVYRTWGVEWKDTNDKVFLLSYEEVWKYLSTDASRMCQPTAYVAALGNLTSDSNCWWWLRALRGKNPACVDPNGLRKNNHFSYPYDVIRPALWVDLNSGIF